MATDGEVAQLGPLPPRPARPDLDAAPQVDYRTELRRRAAIADLERWLRDSCLSTLDALGISGPLLATTVTAYGRHLYLSGAPVYKYQDAVTGVIDACRMWKPKMGQAWHFLSRWNAIEAGRSRPVMPAAMIRAAVVVSLLWGWVRFAACLLLGFAAMLHPCEFLQAQRRHLVSPTDSLLHVPVAFLRIPFPKTRRFARMQHARVTDAVTVQFLSVVFKDDLPGGKLVPFSPSSFRRRWTRC